MQAKRTREIPNGSVSFAALNSTLYPSPPKGGVITAVYHAGTIIEGAKSEVGFVFLKKPKMGFGLFTSESSEVHLAGFPRPRRNQVRLQPPGTTHRRPRI